MSVAEQRTLPAQFVEDLGKDLATQITAQTGVPIVTTGTPCCANTFSAKFVPSFSTKGAGLAIVVCSAII